MTETLNDMAKKKPAEESAEQQAARELVRLAGPGAELFVDGPGRAAETVDEDRPGDGVERGDDRTPRSFQTRPTSRAGNIRNGRLASGRRGKR